jgi:hypothetical protein
VCMIAGGSARGAAAMGGWRIWCCVDVEKDVVPERVRSEVLAAFARMSPHCLNPTEHLETRWVDCYLLA